MKKHTRNRWNKKKWTTRYDLNNVDLPPPPHGKQLGVNTDKLGGGGEEIDII